MQNLPKILILTLTKSMQQRLPVSLPYKKLLINLQWLYAHAEHLATVSPCILLYYSVVALCHKTHTSPVTVNPIPCYKKFYSLFPASFISLSVISCHCKYLISLYKSHSSPVSFEIWSLLMSYKVLHIPLIVHPFLINSWG